MDLPWLYFGCHMRAGHHLRHGDGTWAEPGHPLEKFDGLLCLPETVGERVAALTRLNFCGYSALAFWDRSVDRRPGSNSIVFAPSLTLSAQGIVDGARIHLALFAERWPSIDVTRAELARIPRPPG